MKQNDMLTSAITSIAIGIGLGTIAWLVSRGRKNDEQETIDVECEVINDFPVIPETENK